MRRLTGGLIVLALAVLAVGAATAPASPSTTATVKVKLWEFKLVPTPASVKAGKITFVVRNTGKIQHQFVVIKTNLPPNKLPMKGAAASETGSVGKIGEIDPGQTKSVTLTLKPGSYVLICNLPGHYMLGQRAPFHVS